MFQKICPRPSGVVDNAVYPVLIFDALSAYFDVVAELSNSCKYLVKVALVLALTVPNLVSTPGTGRMLQVFGVLQFMPFVIFVCMGLPRVQVENLITPPTGGPASGGVNLNGGTTTTPAGAPEAWTTEDGGVRGMSSFLFARTATTGVAEGRPHHGTVLWGHDSIVPSHDEAVNGNSIFQLHQDASSSTSWHDGDASWWSWAPAISLLGTDSDSGGAHNGGAGAHNGARPKPMHWFAFLNVVYWNLSGWDCVSTVAGEIDRPSRSLKSALRWALALTVSQYVVILSVAAGIGVVPWGTDFPIILFVNMSIFT